MKWEFFVIIVSCLLIFIPFGFFSKSYIPIREFDCNINTSDSNILLSEDEIGYSSCSYNPEATIMMEMGFIVFLSSILAFIGWIFFWCLAGLGFNAIYVDKIMFWKRRPTRISDFKL